VLAFVAGIAAIVLGVNNSPAHTISQHYYDAIKSQDYAQAYAHLDQKMTLTLQGQEQQLNGPLFPQVAQAYDQTKGKVSDYRITGIQISSSTDSGNIAETTVKVTRNATSYDVHLRLKQEGDDWKIVSFDSL